MDHNQVAAVRIAPATPQCPRHSESDIIRLIDGRLLLGWTEFYAGSGADDGAARLVGRLSADGGLTWGEQYTLVENDGACNVMEVSFLRLGRGDLALFHCRKDAEVGAADTPDCRVVLRLSRDEGRTFGPSRELTGPRRYVETASGRALRLASGRLLLACDAGEAAFCLLSDDEGATWREGTPVRPAAGGCWEPAAVELRDGRVLMLLRTVLGGQYQTISADGGQTWSAPVPSALLGTGAPAAVQRIPGTGDLLALWNHDVGSPRPRNPLTAAVSGDEGVTWEHFRDMAAAPDDAFAYPSVTFTGDMALVTYFGYRGGISLYLKRIPVEWFYG